MWCVLTRPDPFVVPVVAALPPVFGDTLNFRFSDVSLYSLGQDKIPNTLGGGMAFVHEDQELWNYLVEQMETLPFETAWARLVFLLKKIPTFAVYNWRRVGVTLCSEFVLYNARARVCVCVFVCVCV
jgi:hypothetical protein